MNIKKKTHLNSLGLDPKYSKSSSITYIFSDNHYTKDT